MGVNGWAEGLQAQLEIKASTLQDGDPGSVENGISYRTQSVVQLGDSSVPSTLYCTDHCITQTSYDNATNATNFPYTAATDTWDRIDNSSVVSYTWYPDNYSIVDNITGGTLSYDNLTSGSTSTARNGQYAWGFQTGILVPLGNLTALQCDDSNPSNDKFCSWETTGISEYYRWETGENDWNRASFLVRDDNGSTVNFTAPQEISYTVPSNTSGNRPYGELAGATLRLEFQGAGNIGGIPGKCFSIDNNSEVSCDSNSRYVPAFSIPDNASLTVGGATKWVRAMEKEIRFLRLDNVSSDNQSIAYSDNDSLPDALDLGGDANDPSNSSSSQYAGAYPDSFDAAPAVIHGVVQ